MILKESKTLSYRNLLRNWCVWSISLYFFLLFFYLLLYRLVFSLHGGHSLCCLKLLTKVLDLFSTVRLRHPHCMWILHDVNKVIFKPFLADLAVIRIGSYCYKFFFSGHLGQIGGLLQTSLDLFFELAFLDVHIFKVVLLR